jgi:hypothetical protein
MNYEQVYKNIVIYGFLGNKYGQIARVLFWAIFLLIKDYLFL